KNATNRKLFDDSARKTLNNALKRVENSLEQVENDIKTQGFVEGSRLHIVVDDLRKQVIEMRGKITPPAPPRSQETPIA
ncbi:MAG: hypothetical protein ACHQJ6_07070, partial [Candidatus Berkiellales bacterium]